MRSRICRSTRIDRVILLFNPVINCAAIAALRVVCLIIGCYLFASLEKKDGSHRLADLPSLGRRSPVWRKGR